MAIKIQTEKPSIDVEIGELKFEFSIDDNAIKKVYEEAPKLAEKFKKEMNDDNESIDIVERQKKILQEAFSLFLNDEKAFEKIYEQTPSTTMCLSYFIQVAEGLKDDLSERGINSTPQEKAQKYIQNNKKNSTKKKK